jgi:hypothetical protein
MFGVAVRKYLVAEEIGYYEIMRKSASFRILIFAALLAISHGLFASHTATHVTTNPGNCEWCVCQGQSFAGPLPSAEPVAIVRQAGLPRLPIKTRFHPKPVSWGYQSRAPPVSA